ncbi:protein kinase family protein [Mesobacillus foraminis]|uniref:protein kinase family protein n=1 Tax=Mesobacillus foraminis TaxID=279826 RepID=UPI001BE95051|nr:protein kinase family protein [Mesobacillus foraminis]MBT2758746.1 protein kinase family protein [Mesobacillus foraminis]
MYSFSELAQSVKFSMKGSKMILNEKASELELIGAGRSAFAFRIQSTDKVLKVFFSPFEHIAKEEAAIYKALQRNPFYPYLYDHGDNYLVIDYIAGNTLFDCLTKGIAIRADHIKQIDEALSLARERGLNPSDIHLRNIIVTPEDTIKLIDVARFRQVKKCSQWDDLKAAYKMFYRHRMFPKKTPEKILNAIAALYKKNLLPTFH